MTDNLSDNELIAEFMGMPHEKDPFVKSNEKYWHYKELGVMSESLQFDTSWDWLMPVVEKIYQLFFIKGRLSVFGGQTDTSKEGCIRVHCFTDSLAIGSHCVSCDFHSFFVLTPGFVLDDDTKYYISNETCKQKFDNFSEHFIW